MEKETTPFNQISDFEPNKNSARKISNITSLYESVNDKPYKPYLHCLKEKKEIEVYFSKLNLA